MRTIIIGNSGSGKSTLAKQISSENDIPHLDLDGVAWQSANPPTRLPVEESEELINVFTHSHQDWVIEGGYSSLIQYVAEAASKLYFLNLRVQACTDNCRKRPWEQHKYRSKEAQDQNLNMLINWVQYYYERVDDFSYASHRRFFDQYDGEKVEITSIESAEKLVADQCATRCE